MFYMYMMHACYNLLDFSASGHGLVIQYIDVSTQAPKISKKK